MEAPINPALWRSYIIVVHLVLLAALGHRAWARWGQSPQPVEAVIEQPYYKAHRSLLQALSVPAGATIFAGDSLTDHADWEALLNTQGAANFGIAGDNTYGLLHRISDITQRRPARLYLMIGVNDLLDGADPARVLATYRLIVRRVRAESPATQLVVQSVLPVSGEYAAAMSAAIVAFNRQLRELAEGEGARFLDLHGAFTDQGGRLDARYTFDGLHLNGQGYLLWRDRVEVAAAP